MKYLVYLTIFVLPLYVIRGKIFDIPFTLLEILVLTTFAYWLAGILRKKDFQAVKSLIFDKRLITVWLFLIAGIISVVILPDKRAALGILKAYIIEPILFLVVIVDFVKEEKQQMGIFYSLLLSGILASIVAVAQKITGTNIFAPHEIAQGRVTGFFNSANALCLYLIPIATLLFSKILAFTRVKQNRETRKKILLLTVYLVLFLIVIFFSESSGGMLGVIVAFGVVFGFAKIQIPKSKFQTNDKFQIIKRLTWLFLGSYFVFQLLFFTFIPNWTPKLNERPLVRQFDNTVIVRLCLWEGTWRMLQDHFVFGVGLANFPQTYYYYVTCDPELLQYPHNLVLNFWSEMGLLGLLSFGIMIYVYLANIFYRSNGNENYLKKTKETSPFRFGESQNNIQVLNYWHLGLLGILIYYLIHGLVDVPYFKNDLSLMWWIFFGMTFVIKKPALNAGKR